MPKVKEIKSAIEKLSEKDYSSLREWFVERDREKWDKEIERDSTSGKLDFLVREALDEKYKGRFKPL